MIKENMFNYDLLDIIEINKKDKVIINVGKKTIYNTDDCEKLQDWTVKDVKNEKRQDCPQLTSPLIVKQKGSGKTIPNSLGYFYSYGNNVYFNPTNVGLLSSGFSNGHGVGISDINFNKVVISFTARKIIKSSWVNQKDEYLAPNEEHKLFIQFKNDSLIYSLFHSASNQSSLRQVLYKGKLWDIKNEFFWMSAERMEELANNNGYDNLYNDANTSSDRHVYNLLFGEERIYDKLSPDAKAVLDKATELVEKSIKMRMIMSNDEPHLDSWDAGYAQLKLVWKEHFSDDFKEFRQLYKNMEDRMRPLVYELGFLMK